MTEEIRSTKLSRKERIREKYKGVDQDLLDVIPAKPKEDIYNPTKELRVAVYARVSTEDPRQTSSYELQKNHYEDYVKRHEGWKLVKIYADEGISGTSLKKRDEFIQMIQDCKDKKIDLILTKSVSRFARNIMDCIGYIRELAALDPPVGVHFETENIYTLNANSEMSLSFIATLAQEESHNKSEIMNASVDMRFKRGIFLTPPLLGYDQDENGDLVINHEEAKTVRLIFFMYLYGYTSDQIAIMLTSLKRRTKKGNIKWSGSTVISILQNERYCGDVLARKTWTPNYLDHKSKKNRQDRNQYLQKNHHEAIIARDDFVAVQRLIRNARYGHRGLLPTLHVIEEGALKGFVPINPRWSGFKADNYLHASNAAGETLEEPLQFTAYEGDFDLRGFEIARGHFFNTNDRLNVSFSNKEIRFSLGCIRKFSNNMYVELLIHPYKKAFAVRHSKKENRSSVKWAYLSNGEIKQKPVAGSAFLSTIFELLEWDERYKYRAMGTFQEKDGESVIMFSLKEVEMIIPNDLVADDDTDYLNTTQKNVPAYPASWVESFGNNFYENAQTDELAPFNKLNIWDIQNEGTPIHMDPPLNVTSMDEVGQIIDDIVEVMKQEITYENHC